MCSADDLIPAQTFTAQMRLTFLEACVDAGLVDRIPALDCGATVANPPDGPRLLVNHRGLPRALRVLIHEENIARTNGYAAAFRAYVERYCALVEAAESPAALRALGRPAALYVPAGEPGLDFDGDDDLVWDFDRRVERFDDSALTHTVHKKTFAFRHAA